MVKIAFIFGTRPEAIKLAPLIKLFQDNSDFKVEVCSTGQHKEMLDQILVLFGIKPNIDLRLMTHNQSLAEFLSTSLLELGNYLKDSKPDFLFVQGDTSTVLAAALAAFYNQIKVLHVEAGLRTSSLFSPFPEEMNRRLTSQLSFRHFAPTTTAKENLLKEGVKEERILVTGNTSIDALLQVKEAIEKQSLLPKLDSLIMEEISRVDKVVLITGHRRENFGSGLDRICEAVEKLSIKFPNALFLYPVHLNPNVKDVVYSKLGELPNVRLIPPQGYVEFVYLMMKSTIILTDSGGVQEEAPTLMKPILVMRENTERPEGVQVGCSKLVGTDVNQIINEVGKLLNDDTYYKSFNSKKNPYGDGKASKKILDYLIKLKEEVNFVY